MNESENRAVETNSDSSPENFEATILATSADQLDNPLRQPEGASWQFERYQHLRELGQGAMGTVALMQDVLLRRQVAYKQIKSEALTQPEVLNQFLGEAQITSQLEHPGVVPVYSLEVLDDGQIAYAMKVVEGQTLKARIEAIKAELQQQPDIRRWQQALRSLLEDFLKVCDAMAYAHSKGVIHRDLKPSNIMFGRFHEVYLLDWGIAQVIDPAAGVVTELGLDALRVSELASKMTSELDLTQNIRLGEQTRPLVGTPRYMSPEQIKGKELTPASDLFTLGLILQELVCLQTAVQARTLAEVLVKILKPSERPVLHALSLPVPTVLKAIIAKATAIKLAERYASVQELADELRRVLLDQETRVLPDNLWNKGLRWMRHHSAQALSTALLLVISCALAIGGSLWAWQQTLTQTRLHQQALERILKQGLIASQSVDSQMGRFEALLTHLGAGAAEAWQRGKAEGELFELPGGLAKTDFAKAYWQGPPAKVRQLTALLPSLQSQLARAQDPLAVPRDWLKNPHSPIQAAVLEFKQPATALVYPLSSAAAERALAFEALMPQASLKAAEPYWTRFQPAVAAQGLLALGLALSDDSGSYLGTAGLLIESRALVQTLPKSPRAFVISDKNLDTVISSGPVSVPPQVQQALKARQSGFYEQAGSIWLYQPLASQGWYLTLEFELQSYLEPEHG